jgi:purine-binding chemotaxis protein CheW
VAPIEVLVGTIAGKAYAFPVESVQEIVQLVEPTPMPEWPDEALGMIEIRGTLVPLLDAATFLGSQPVPLSPSQFVLVLEVAGRTWGILLDTVEGVRTGTVRPTDSLAPGRGGKNIFTRGVISRDGVSVVVVDAEKLVGAVGLPENGNHVLPP